MQAAVGGMFIWIDYMSMPQPHGGPLPEDENDMQQQKEEKSAGNAGFTTDRINESPDSRSHRQTAASAQASDPKLGALLSAAVESIPAYVEQSALMLVLVPPCKHADRPGEIASLQSWRGRGWCRMEFMAAVLSRTNLRVMAVQGPEALPEFVWPADALFLAVGEGKFTCCAQNHSFNGRYCVAAKTHMHPSTPPVHSPHTHTYPGPRS